MNWLIGEMMSLPLHLCGSVHAHAALWPLLAGGAVDCAMHCAGVCIVCVSGGTAIGHAFYGASRMLANHLLPALFAAGGVALLSHAGGIC